MSSKIEVSRAQFEATNPVPYGVFWSDPDSRYMTSMVHLNCLEYQGKWIGWQSAISAAPVVERQPVEVLGYSVVGNRYAIAATKGEIIDLHEGYADHMIELVDRKHVTCLQAELAELQATIARLTAENEQKEKEWTDRFHMVCECAIRPIVIERDEARAEIERLKGGQGEPVAWMLDGSVGGDSLEFQAACLVETQTRYGGCLVPLYREQPAPVSVALDPHAVANSVRTALDRKACPNAWMVIAYDATVDAVACLDKVKELNGLGA